MTERRAELLKAIIEEYVKTAEPIGSAFLAGKSFDVSPATIRKEMAALEEDGYLDQPHTSAGRVPTELAYRHYIQYFLKPKEVASKKMSAMAKGLREPAEDARATMKNFAKALADFTEQTVVLGFGPRDIYFTGVSNLFSKPEFGDAGHAASLSSVVDRFDDIISRIFESSEGIAVQVGRECDFGAECGAVLVKCVGPNGPMLVALVGPMRMPYDRLLGIANQTKLLLEE